MIDTHVPVFLREAKRDRARRLFNVAMLIAILAVAGALVIGSIREAHAAGTAAQVSWSPPTAYNDASALPISDIASYTLAWTGSTSGSKTVTGTSTSVAVACGSVAFTVTVTTNAGAKFPNATSAPAGPVPYATGVTCGPNPPTALTVT